MEKGSIRGSIFALSASAVGSGVLSLPYVLKLNGYVAGVCFMIVAALAAQTTLKMLATVACEFRLKSYSAVCKEAGGKKLQNLMSIMVIIFMFGACVGFQIILTSLFRYLVH